MRADDGQCEETNNFRQYKSRDFILLSIERLLPSRFLAAVTEQDVMRSPLLVSLFPSSLHMGPD